MRREHRRLIEAAFPAVNRRGGRPATQADIDDLVDTMARVARRVRLYFLVASAMMWFGIATVCIDIALRV
jgi:hypothetical protein